MKNILTITRLTIQEAFARKVFIAFFLISSIVLLCCLGIFLSFSVESFLGPVEEMIKQSKGKIVQDALTMFVNGIKATIAMPLFGLGLFLSIFSVSSFIPNMLEKGHVDVILSKPVSRIQVLFGKFFGGLVVVFFNVAYLIAGIWLLIGIKFGVWDTQFLYTIITITFTFALFYSLIILLGVTSQNSILSMMVCYFIFIIISPLLASRETIFEFIRNGFIKTILDVLYYIVPQTDDLGGITLSLVKGEAIKSLSPIYTSIVQMILIFGLSIFIFRKKDY